MLPRQPPGAIHGERHVSEVAGPAERRSKRTGIGVIVAGTLLVCGVIVLQSQQPNLKVEPGPQLTNQPVVRYEPPPPPTPVPPGRAAPADAGTSPTASLHAPGTRRPIACTSGPPTPAARVHLGRPEPTCRLGNLALCSRRPAGRSLGAGGCIRANEWLAGPGTRTVGRFPRHIGSGQRL